jgi:hypothetical protein
MVWLMSEKIDIESQFVRLRGCLARNDADGVQDAIFGLSPLNNDWRRVPDEVVERLLTLLQGEEMYTSPLGGHVLNYFELESPHLSVRQKAKCIDFLKSHGDLFVDSHSSQVVTELRFENYLR